MENKSNTLSVVVPVYNEEDNILPLVSAVHNALIDERRQWELLIVDDGSSDDTWDRLEQARSEFGDHVRIFELNKNFGQTAAMQAGLDKSRGELVVTMDGDLQNDPKDIIKMINVYNENQNILVHGFRKNRNDPYFTKILPSKIANFIVRKFTNSNILDHGCSLKIFDKRMINANNFFGDFHRLFAAQINKDIKIIEKFSLFEIPVLSNNFCI